MRNYATEFIGTFFLCLTVGLTAVAAASQAPLAIGAMLAAVTFLGSPRSGAHCNPAVSLAFLLRRGITPSRFGGYVLSQLLAAMLAGVMCQLISGGTAAPAPAAEASAMGAFLAEAAFTFALVLVILATAGGPGQDRSLLHGLGAGLTYGAAIVAAGSISGGAYNPAVGVGLGLVHAMLTGASMSHAWIYVAGPLAGGALAAVLYRSPEAAAP